MRNVVRRKAPRKTRGDSLLDQKLTPAQADKFFDFGETHVIEDSVRYLLRKHKITYSTGGVSRWLAKRRKRLNDEQWINRLVRVRQASERSQAAIETIGSVSALNQSNLAILGQMTQDALISGNPQQMALAAMWLEAVGQIAKDKRADAAVRDSETAFQRFRFDAAKAALAQAAELQAINRSKCSESEKVQKAIDRIWGKEPQGAAAVA